MSQAFSFAIGQKYARTPFRDIPAVFDYVYDVRMFGAKSDGIALYDASTTASANSVVSSTSANFNQNDVGKVCAIVPKTDTGLTPRWGTIVSVQNSGQITTSLSGSPGALSNATFVYGTDDKVAIAATLAEVSLNDYKGAVRIPLGLTLTTEIITVPSGAYLEGVYNSPTGGKAKDFKHYGSSLLLAKYQASGAFVTLGDISNDPRGAGLRNINVDCLNFSGTCVAGTGARTNRIYECTIVRGFGDVVSSGPTGRVYNNVILGQNAGNVLVMSGDSSCHSNIITGAGNGAYGIKCSNGDDILILGNHIWKDSSASTMLGGSIWLSYNSDTLLDGSVIVANNKLDTNYGPAMKISVSGNGTTARGLQLLGNVAFNNDSVANNTGSVIDISVDNTCSLRGLVLANNNARGSWESTNGQWQYLVKATLTGSGAIYGSWAGGNVADNCNDLYSGFVPDLDLGNMSIAGSGTTVTKSTVS